MSNVEIPSELDSLSISQIRELAVTVGPDESFIDRLAADSRAGVNALAKKLIRDRDKLTKQSARQEELKAFERKLRGEGFSCIAGVDEAGRGPLAGPVVAGAVILPEDVDLPGLDDSKKIPKAKREELFDLVTSQALYWGIGMVDNEEIDNTNILAAAMKAMRIAVKTMKKTPDIALIDGNRAAGSECRERTVIDGDARCLSIAAASIIAKVTRDRIMLDMDEMYPGYGFAGHKGYGAQSHIAAIAGKGPSDIHRLTFRVVTKVAPVGTVASIMRRRLENAPSKKTFEAIVNSIARLREYMKRPDIEELRDVYRSCSERFSPSGGC